MRGFLGTIAILLVILAAVGYYRGWFTVNVDQNQVQKDEKVLNDKIQQFENKANDQLNKAAQKAKDAANR
jgi:hypothetical protein